MSHSSPFRSAAAPQIISQWEEAVRGLNLAVRCRDADSATLYASRLAARAAPVLARVVWRREQKQSQPTQTGAPDGAVLANTQVVQDHDDKHIFKPGDAVEYFSGSSGTWIPATIQNRAADTDRDIFGPGSAFVLDVKPGWALASWRLRPRSPVGDEEIGSTTAKKPATESSEDDWWSTQHDLSVTQKADNGNRVVQLNVDLREEGVQEKMLPAPEVLPTPAQLTVDGQVASPSNPFGPAVVPPMKLLGSTGSASQKAAPSAAGDIFSPSAASRTSQVPVAFPPPFDSGDASPSPPNPFRRERPPTGKEIAASALDLRYQTENDSALAAALQNNGDGGDWYDDSPFGARGPSQRQANSTTSPSPFRPSARAGALPAAGLADAHEFPLAGEASSSCRPPEAPHALDRGQQQRPAAGPDLRRYSHVPGATSSSSSSRPPDDISAPPDRSSPSMELDAALARALQEEEDGLGADVSVSGPHEDGAVQVVRVLGPPSGAVCEPTADERLLQAALPDERGEWAKFRDRVKEERAAAKARPEPLPDEARIDPQRASEYLEKRKEEANKKRLAVARYGSGVQWKDRGDAGAAASESAAAGAKTGAALGTATSPGRSSAASSELPGEADAVARDPQFVHNIISKAKEAKVKETKRRSGRDLRFQKRGLGRVSGAFRDQLSAIGDAFAAEEVVAAANDTEDTTVAKYERNKVSWAPLEVARGAGTVGGPMLGSSTRVDAGAASSSGDAPLAVACNATANRAERAAATSPSHEGSFGPEAVGKIKDQPLDHVGAPLDAAADRATKAGVVTEKDEIVCRPAAPPRAVLPTQTSSVADENINVSDHDDQLQKFTCPLCFDLFSASAMIELRPCAHRFCEEDFLALLTSKITDGLVQDDELCCPMPGCKSSIPTELIERELRLKKAARADAKEALRLEALWDKFLQFRLQLFKPKTGKIIACPECECPAIVSWPPEPGLFEIPCQECGARFCPSCGRKPHPEFKSCEAYRKYLEENNPDAADKKLEEVLERENWCRCPVCGVPVEREAGCNFMQCPSPLCRNKTFFCYVCGEQVAKANHYAHYQKGPYEDFCVKRPEGVRGKKAVYVPDEEEGRGANARFWGRFFGRDGGVGGVDDGREPIGENHGGTAEGGGRAGWFGWLQQRGEQAQEVVRDQVRAVNDNVQGGYKGYEF